jgi:carboxypeptidase Taq
MEKDLFSGKTEVKDLEKIWNEKYKEYLGVDVKNAKEGILQDMHWPYAYFGYFPTYALGSAFAAQIAHTMEQQIDVQTLLAESKYTEVTAWLKEHVQKDGAMYSSLETVKRATGEDFTPEYYTDYLRKKYSAVYNL